MEILHIVSVEDATTTLVVPLLCLFLALKKILANIYDRNFCENRERVLAHNFRKNSSIIDAWRVHKWDKVSKSGSSKICGRQPLKYLKGHGLFKQTISLQIF